MNNIITYDFCILCYKKINTNIIKCSICNGTYHDKCYSNYVTKTRIICCPFCKNKSSCANFTK